MSQRIADCKEVEERPRNSAAEDQDVVDEEVAFRWVQGSIGIMYGNVMVEPARKGEVFRGRHGWFK